MASSDGLRLNKILLNNKTNIMSKHYCTKVAQQLSAYNSKDLKLNGL